MMGGVIYSGRHLTYTDISGDDMMSIISPNFGSLRHRVVVMPLASGFIYWMDFSRQQRCPHCIHDGFFGTLALC